MIRLYFLFVTILLATSAIAQWFPQNSGTQNSLNSVYFTDYNTGYSVGDSGTILKTTNGGELWFPVNSGTTRNLRSINFITPDTGYAVGQNVILKTEDAGVTWIDQTPSGLSEWVSLKCVHFPVVDTGYIVGDTIYDQGWSGLGLIYKTVNGGSTWDIDTIIQGAPGFPFTSLNSVYFLDANVGFACGGIGGAEWSGLILKTVNGGLDWSSDGKGSVMNSIYFPNDSVGFCVGNDNANYAAVYKTTNTGSTWSDGYYFSINTSQVFFTNMDTGYIVGYDTWNKGYIMKTIDGGTSWLDPIIVCQNGLNSTFFTDGLTGYVVGRGGVVFKTMNGGTTTVNKLLYSNSELEIYPNPALSEIKLKISAPSSFGHITIMNSQGQTIQKYSASSKQLQIDISSLRSGIYFVRFQNEYSMVVKKFLKK
jgi:photosystem II stability/assembly factor-like uncharacterized protein